MLNKIKGFLKSKGQSVWALQINGELVQMNFAKRDRDNKPTSEVKRYTIHVLYDYDVKNHDDSEGGKVVFGYYASVDGRRIFIKDDSDEIEGIVLKILSNTLVLGLDLGFTEDLLDISFETNRNLRLLNIKQNTFDKVSQEFYFEGATPRSMDPQTHKLLLERLDTFYLTNYANLLKNVVLRYLSSVRRSNMALKKLELFPVFCYVFISGSCITNPFLERKSYCDVIFKTKLFAACKEHIIEAKGLTIYAASMKKISEALNFSEYIKITPLFLFNVLAGLFSNRFPNDKEFSYLNPTDSSVGVLSEEQYLGLMPEQRAGYLKVSSLYLLCSRYFVSLAQPSVPALYEAVKTASLKFE